MSMGASKREQHLKGSDRKAGAPHSFTFPRDPRSDVPTRPPNAGRTRPTKNRLAVKLAGEAGFGIATSGLLLTKALSRGGLQAMDYTEYPSLIRGGHNVFLLRVDEQPVRAAISRINVLVALNKASIFLHEAELTEDGAVIYDTDEIELDPGEDLERPDLKLYGLPLEALALKHGGEKLMRNVVGLGAFLALTGYPFEILEEVIGDVFGSKGKGKMVEANRAAAKAGYDYLRDNFPEQFTYVLQPKAKPKPQVAATGGEAIALGAVAAGCQFYSAYPMTPASPVLHYLAATQQETGMVVKHAEDEIAAINQAIGASFTGVRAMTGSAGGGFALMVESLGLAAITETPLVIIEAQRPGPATGLPTWTDQADLRFVMHAAQGEFPRVILTPGDAEECFHFTYEAFNLAERFQLPVFVLVDKFLTESHFTTAPYKPGSKIDRGKLMTEAALKKLTRRYKRYELVDDGVSPRTIPGQEGGVFMANSDEHDEFGYSSEDAKMRIGQMDKRFAKVTEIAQQVPEAVLHGPTTAELTLVGWGSTKGAIMEAIDHLKDENITANFLQLRTLWPFPVAAVEAAFRKANRTLLVEGNYTGQLTGLVREHTGAVPDHTLYKYDGRPIYPEEIYHQAVEVVRG